MGISKVYFMRGGTLYEAEQRYKWHIGKYGVSVTPQRRKIKPSGRRDLLERLASSRPDLASR